MFEDIAPAVEPAKKIKIHRAAQDKMEPGFPFDSQISFLPFINFLRNSSTRDSETRTRFYNYLVEKFEQEPALLTPLKDENVLSEHSGLMEMLGTSLFPVVTESEKNIFTLTVPYQFSVFNDSPAFRKLFVDDKGNFLMPENATDEYLKQVHSSLIYEHAL